MARRRPISADPMIRSIIRSGVRAGRTAADIENEVTERFPRATPGAVSRIYRQESTRQQAVDKVMNRDFRKRTNLHAIVGCGAGERVRGRIVVEWTDPQTGHTRQFGQTLEFANQGRLGDILNTAIGSVLEDAVGRGYKPPAITAGGRTPGQGWRLEYLECI